MKKGLLGKLLKIAAIVLIGLAAKNKVRGEVGSIAKDIDPDLIKDL